MTDQRIVVEIVPVTRASGLQPGRKTPTASPTTRAGEGGVGTGGAGGKGIIGGIASGISFTPMAVGISFGVTAIMNILKDMSWSLKPILSMVSAIGKMIGVFLQPIAEMLLFLLRPILHILKPVVTTFRDLMRPITMLLREAGPTLAMAAGSQDVGSILNIISKSILPLLGIIFTQLTTFLGSLAYDLINVVGKLLIDIVAGVMASFMPFSKNAIMESARDLKQNLSNNINGLKSTLFDLSDSVTDYFLDLFRTDLEIVKSTMKPELHSNVTNEFLDWTKEFKDRVSKELRTGGATRAPSKPLTLPGDINPNMSLDPNRIDTMTAFKIRAGLLPAPTPVLPTGVKLSLLGGLK